MQLEVVVPAFDEEARLGRTLAALTAALAALPVTAAVIVVDNASRDRTAEVAAAGGTAQVPVRVVGCGVKGKGNAVAVGVLASRAPWVGFMDADLATDLGAMPVALAELMAGHPVVIGSRALDRSEVTARPSVARRLGALAFRRAVSAVVAGVTDSQCGFKFFDGHVARAVFAELVDGGFAFDVEVLARCQARGLTIREIPVRWDDQPGSTFSPTRDGLNSFLQVWHIARRTRTAARHVPSLPAVISLPVGSREAELATGA